MKHSQNFDELIIGNMRSENFDKLIVVCQICCTFPLSKFCAIWHNVKRFTVIL